MNDITKEAGELKALLVQTATHLLKSGREVNPNLHLFLPNGILIPTVVAWTTNKEKLLYFDAFSKMIAALKPTLIGFSTEAWMQRKAPGQWVMQSPSEDPAREDSFIILIRSPEQFEIGTAPIITKDGRRSLGTLEWNPLDATGPLTDIFTQA